MAHQRKYADLFVSSNGARRSVDRSKSGGRSLQIAPVWSSSVARCVRDATVLIPAVDAFFVLVDTDDVPHARLEVDADTLVDVLPHIFEPVQLAGEVGVTRRTESTGELDVLQRSLAQWKLPLSSPHPPRRSRRCATLERFSLHAITGSSRYAYHPGSQRYATRELRCR